MVLVVQEVTEKTSKQTAEAEANILGKFKLNP